MKKFLQNKKDLRAARDNGVAVTIKPRIDTDAHGFFDQNPTHFEHL
jgi:hypothetical protein